MYLYLSAIREPFVLSIESSVAVVVAVARERCGGTFFRARSILFFFLWCWQRFFALFFFFGYYRRQLFHGRFGRSVSTAAKTSLQKRNTKQRTNANSFRATVGAPPREKILRRADDDGDDDDGDSKKNALLVRVLHVFFSFFSSTRNVVTISNEERHIRFLFWSSTKQLSRDDE